MAKLSEYKSLTAKNKFFKISNSHLDNKIDSPAKFNRWYNEFTNSIETKKKWEQYFFRGMGEAKHKIFNSAQRLWLTTEIGTWKPDAKYEDFLQKFIDASKKDPLFKRVFEFYKVKGGRIDFPVLSIIQHYGGPTPLMDWSYDLNVALFFATESIKTEDTSNELDDYFSIYIINKEKTEIQSIGKYDDKAYPALKRIFDRAKTESSETRKLFYLSDYEADNIKEPLTTIYNQNIIPQKGVFIFNPSHEKPLEEYFDKNVNHNPDMSQFMCYNIRKDLAEYVRRKISSKGIVKNLIYPDVRSNTNKIKEDVLNSYFKQP